MSIPLFIPPVEYVNRLNLENSSTIRELCAIAGVRCKASGSWTERRVGIVYGEELSVVAEPGGFGAVSITMKSSTKEREARLALAALAYGMHDLVAKESIKGIEWARVAPPRGRPSTGRALTSAERQRRFRERRNG